MTAIVLAALSAAIWGVGDFAGGKATQRAHPLATTVLAKLAALPALILALLAYQAQAPRPDDVGWGALAGLAGIAGLVLLYRGLSSGAMAVFAPISAVTSAIVPMVWGLLLERAPTALELLGAACAVVSIGLVSVGAAARSVSAPMVGRALLSGVMFGAFFIGLAQARPGSGLWPVVSASVAALAGGALVVAWRRVPAALPRQSLAWAGVAGVFDATANAAYFVAAGRGLLSVVAPIAALYPVSTVLLALVVERERVRLRQALGLGLAGAALVLVSV